MAVTSKALIETQYAQSSETAHYTAAANTTAVVRAFVAHNVSGSAVTLSVSLVEVGGTVADSRVVTGESIAAGETYILEALSGQVLGPGTAISAIAGAGSTIVIRCSGIENT